jgi:tetratricopeptide (TPR) repeat protein
MKKLKYLLFLLVILASCTSQKNSREFIASAQGRYLFNENEVIEIYFKEQILHAKWRGNNDIELLKINDSSFYMKELNEKMMFVNQAEIHIQLAPKTEHKGVKYYFRRMKNGDKTPNEYFKANQFGKALTAFKAIQERDSLSPAIKQHTLNRLGYKYIDKGNFNAALEIFKINAILYPKKLKRL